MKIFFSLVIMCFFLNSCVSKNEKAKNIIPYKYRTVEQVKMACENQMKENSNNNANAGSDVGNFLLGIIKGLEEDWACDPLR